MTQQSKHIHFIGAGGIGMSALAKWEKAQGREVSGCDLHASDLTRSLEARGARVFSGHDVVHLAGVDLVVYSGAVPESHPERQEATRLGIAQKSYAQFLGERSADFSTIVVSGTHGKSTTTAMLGLILEAAGYDPSVLVGSLVPEFPLGNLRIGKGRFFVAEGCEYKRHFLELQPEMVVVNNIEPDHLDYYKNIDDIRSAFQSLCDKLKDKGMVVSNGDDPQVAKLSIARGTTFGMNKQNTYAASERTVEAGTQSFTLCQENACLGRITLQVPGAHNVMNALAAISTAMELGVPFDVCKKALASFKGIWRRFERLGTWQGAELVSDYGHHPTAIRATIGAARELFPGRRIVLCFQPHQHSRTKELLPEFAAAVAQADAAVIPEIYGVAGRTEDDRVSSKDVVKTAKASNPHISFAKDLADAEGQLRDLVNEGDVLIVQGAGDIDELARKLSSCVNV